MNILIVRLGALGHIVHAGPAAAAIDSRPPPSSSIHRYAFWTSSAACTRFTTACASGSISRVEVRERPMSNSRVRRAMAAT